MDAHTFLRRLPTRPSSTLSRLSPSHANRVSARRSLRYVSSTSRRQHPKNDRIDTSQPSSSSPSSNFSPLRDLQDRRPSTESLEELLRKIDIARNKPTAAPTSAISAAAAAVSAQDSSTSSTSSYSIYSPRPAFPGTASSRFRGGNNSAQALNNIKFPGSASAPISPSRKVDLKLSPTIGRQVYVEPDRGMDLASALRVMGANLAANKVRQQSNAQRFHVRRGQMKKNLRMERWRRLFKFSFSETVKKIQKMRAQGW